MTPTPTDQRPATQLRSYPLGLTGIDDDGLVEGLAYDTDEAKPRPLTAPRDAAFFANLARYPTPRLARPCRKIVFSFRSKDQGWTTQPDARGTYASSWTWFEAGLERFDAEQDCEFVWSRACPWWRRRRRRPTREGSRERGGGGVAWACTG